MSYILTALVIYLFIAGAMFYLQAVELETIIIGVIGILLSYSIIISIDYFIKTTDTEVWSGKITKVEHKEEWDEWHPPRTETYTTTDSNGKTTTHTRTIPGYWEHHDAENRITTSDQGTIYVYQTPDGKRFTDDFVNTTEELAKYYPIGQATASTHSYRNKVQASYSIFKNKDINLNDYPDLFEYPDTKNNYYSINRLLGNFKNKDNKSKYLDAINSNLNDTDNKNNKDKVKSYKQVNVIVANFGDKSIDYGYALQDYWENGNKNDLVITFGTDKNNKPTWCYVFSWSDVEILKTDIREEIMAVNDINKEFNNTLDNISSLIEQKFKRKEFAEFEYIQIDISLFSKILLAIILTIAIVCLFII